ncbi:MAG: hypothetical protein IPP25_11795 [Saprospiraceae bacterium]|nr:hypothetical protein [Candidatus Opimibacter skivensis]
MKILIWVLAFVVASIILFYVPRKVMGTDTTSIQKEMAYGPFVIRAEAITGKTYNINYGMVKQTNISYSIWFEGKPVEFPSALQTNTGLPYLWRVHALPDAPTPTLLAGSQSLYLVYIKDGQPVVEPVIEQSSDFASVQFLDSEGGQPGAYMQVFSRSDTIGMDQLDTLQGGRYLLVSEHTVLDIPSLKLMLFNKENNAVDNYSYPQPDGALAFSPDRKKIVFNAAFQSWNTEQANLPDSEHALVVYDFETDKGYSVLYDDTDTRMKNFEDINLDWFNTYFEWNTNGDTLSLKKWDKLPYWTGSFKEKDNYYYLYPVKASMLPVFKDFVLQQMEWGASNVLSDKTAEYSGRTIELGSGTTKLDIVFREDEQQISFSRGLYENDSPAYKAMVEKIARAFDEELRSGKHQEHFGRIVSETKRILEL